MADLDTKGDAHSALAASAIVSGLTPFFRAALAAAVQTVKASSGRIYGYHIHNPDPDDHAFVQFFNNAAPVVGTTTPDFVLFVPADGGVDMVFPCPIAFGTAITVAATLTPTGAAAPTTALVANAWYA